MNEDMVKTLSESAKHRTKHPYWVWESLQEIPEILGKCLEEPTLGQIQAITNEIDKRNIQTIVFLGRGSSYFLTLPVKFLFDQLTTLNTNCRVTNVFEAYDLASLNNQTAVFFMSHSGKSEGDIQVVRKSNEKGAMTIGVTDISTAPLAKEVDFVLLGPGGSKVELPATRTYASAMYRMMQLAVENGKRQKFSEITKTYEANLKLLPELLKSFIPDFEHHAGKIAKELINSYSFIFIGIGPNLATADEAAMAFSQATYLPSQAFEMENFIHGPMQALTEDQAVFLIAPEGPLQDRILRLAEACQIIGAKTVLLAPGSIKNRVEIETFVEMPDGIMDIVSPVVYMVPLWQIGYHLGLLGKGGHPDRLSMDKEIFKEAFSHLMKKDKWVTQK